MSFVSSKDMLILVGMDEPHITFLKGGQWGPERTRSVFKGGSWTIYPDGTFMFQPAVMADVRNDLYPIKGIYTRIGDTLEFQGKQQCELGASSALDGTMKMEGDAIALDIIHTVASSTQCIARVTQVLSFGPPITEPEICIIIKGIRIPSLYTISLSGDVDGNLFGPLNGSLKLFLPDDTDSNPFRVELSTENTGSIGTLFWTSFSQYPHGQGLSCGTVTLNNEDLIILETRDNNSRISPSWFTRLSVLYVGDITQGVTGKQGKLTFSLRDGHISGTIHATGTSNLQQISVYQAQLLGTQRTA